MIRGEEGKISQNKRWRMILCSLMCDILGLGSNRSRLLAGRAPVCPTRSYLPAAHRTHGSSSPHWPTEEMKQEVVISTEFMTSDDLASTYSKNYFSETT